MRRTTRRGLAAALLVFLVAASAPARGARKEDPGESAPDKPTLRLRVTPRHGFRPLTLTLSGQLSGVDPSDQQYCHAGIEWEATTPTSLTVVSREDPKCLHPPEQVQVQTSFTKIVTLARPGTYVYRLILHRRDGERLLSNTQEVRVLDNR